MESGQAPRQIAGAMFFREERILPERVVPLLSQSLASTNKALIEAAASALGEYGYKARSALPALSRLTNHPNRFVSGAAEKSVKKIQEASARAQNGRDP